MTAVWAGIDSGKRAHHCAVIDTTGRMRLSRRVVNDEAALVELIAAVLALASGDQVVWATDLNTGGAALLIALLAERGQRVLYIPGRIVHHVDAANAQRTVLRTEAVAARLVAQLAEQIAAIDTEIARVDEQISERFDQHRDAPILLSMPGFGTVLAATFLANTGGDLAAFETVDKLASVAGLAPAPRDSGRISGNHHRPKRFNRRLRRTCYLAALSA